MAINTNFSTKPTRMAWVHLPIDKTASLLKNQRHGQTFSSEAVITGGLGRAKVNINIGLLADLIHDG